MKFLSLVFIALCSTFAVDASELKVVSVVARNNGCQDPNRGSFTVTISGGVAPYTYSACIQSDPPGSCNRIIPYPPTNETVFTMTNLFVIPVPFYAIIVADSNGHEVTSTPGLFAGWDIPALNPVAFTLAAEAPVCAGGNGLITVTATGGNGLYSASLNGGPFSAPAASPFTIPAAAGSYTVQLQDSSGCPQPPGQQITVDQSTATPVTANVSSQDAVCFGANGAVTITAQGGSGLYTYSIDGAPVFPLVQPSPIIFPAPARSYSITVFDSLGCSAGAPQSVTVKSPTLVTFDFAFTNECQNLPNGSITVSSAAGGSGQGYSASINGGIFQPIPVTFSSLAAGTYMVIAQDSNGCQSNPQQITLTGSTAMTSIIAVQNVPVNGASTGSLAIKAIYGGVAPYTWDIGTGISQSSDTPFTGLRADTYTVTITDSNGCLAPFQQVIVTQPESPEIVEVISTNATTLVTSAKSSNSTQASRSAQASLQADATSPNGSLRIVADSRTSLQYSINGLNGPFQDSPLFTGLVAGTYALAVRPRPDCSGASAVGCGVVGSILPVVVSATVTPQNCTTGAKGSITVIASGGTAPYFYKINDGALQSSNFFGNLSSGTYTITAVDAENHTGSIVVKVQSIRTPTGNPLADFIAQKCGGCSISS